MSKCFRKWARNPLGSACRSSGPPALENEHVIQSPHRLVVRTSRCGRDNPGSTPGVVMQVRRTAEIHGTDRMPDTPASMSGVGHAYAFQTGAQSARAAARAHMTSISCPTGSGGLRHSGVPGHQSLLDH